MRVAALDDDEAQLDAVSQLVRSAGHRCLPFRSAKSLITELRRESFDLLILDWNLPDMSGPEIIEWVRRNLSDAPAMLLLTSRTAEADIVEGLRAGADDYVVKPFQAAVLQARIAALLRRDYSGRAPEKVEDFEGYRFDAAAEEVVVRGQAVALSPKEFSLAWLLFRNLHCALSRAHMLEAVWGRNPDLPTRTLDIHISRLRTKLNIRPENGYRIVPVHGYGYRLESLRDGQDADGPSAGGRSRTQS